MGNLAICSPFPPCRQVELAALLQYVANQLKGTESLDLLVLKEILATMTVRISHHVQSPCSVIACDYIVASLELPAAHLSHGLSCSNATSTSPTEFSSSFPLSLVPPLQGIQAVFDVSEFQLDALAGSETLRTEVVTQGEHRSSSKSLKQGTARLIAALRQVGMVHQVLYVNTSLYKHFCM